MENKIVVKEWYARRTAYGVSKTAHKVLYNEETKNSMLLCRMAGSYKPGALLEVQVSGPKDRNICPECMTATVKLVEGRIKNKENSV